MHAAIAASPAFALQTATAFVLDATGDAVALAGNAELGAPKDPTELKRRRRSRLCAELPCDSS